MLGESASAYIGPSAATMKDDLVRLTGLHAPVAALAYASDGARIFAAAADGAVLAWPGGGGAPPSRWMTFPGAPLTLDVERRGASIVVAGADAVRAATLGTDGGVAVRALLGEAAPVIAARFVSDGRVLVAFQGGDGLAYLALADPGGAAPARTAIATERAVAGCVPSRYGLRALITFADGGMAVADLEDGGWLELPGTAGTGGRPATLDPDGRRVAVALDSAVQLWDAAALAPSRVLAAPGRVVAVAFGAPGQLLAVTDDAVALLPCDGDGASGVFPHGAPVRDAIVRRDGAVLAVLGEGGEVSVWRAGVLGAPLRPAARATAIALDPRGRELALGTAGGDVLVLPFDEGWRTVPQPARPGPWPHPLFGEAVVWANTGQLAHPFFAHHQGKAWVVAFNDDFPARSAYTLLGEGVAIDFDDWPPSWWRPY